MGRRVCRLGLLAAMVAPLLGIACDQPVASRRYQGFVGVVQSTDLETCELFLRLNDQQHARPIAAQTLVWWVDDGSEIYVNDRAATLADVRDGDAAEILGYRGDATDGPDRFVISQAHIKREQRVPSPPDFSAPVAEAAPAAVESP